MKRSPVHSCERIRIVQQMANTSPKKHCAQLKQIARQRPAEQIQATLVAQHRNLPAAHRQICTPHSCSSFVRRDYHVAVRRVARRLERYTTERKIQTCEKAQQKSHSFSLKQSCQHLVGKTGTLKLTPNEKSRVSRLSGSITPLS